MRVALYARVSTEEQARSGYSIPSQKRRLADHVKREGWQVVEVIADEGYSATTMKRPGLERIMQIAEAGKIDAVLAIRRDRYFRRMRWRYEFDDDLKSVGAKLLALNDTGNKIGDAVTEAQSEVEIDTFRERVAEGKEQKAVSGKVVGGHRRSYGYDWIKGPHKGKQTTTGYEVREDEMSIVRRIYSAVASGTGLRTIKDELDMEYVPTPRKGRVWSRTFMRALIFDDLYKPHSIEELRELEVSEVVLTGLDAESVHGVYRYRGIPDENGMERRIPVPISDAGIPSEIISEARRRLSENVSTSKSNNRFWELSGGILRCAECGLAMQANTIRRKGSERGDIVKSCGLDSPITRRPSPHYFLRPTLRF